MAGLLFDMSTELETHRRQHFRCEVVFAARGKPLKQRGGQNRRGGGGFDGGGGGPAGGAGRAAVKIAFFGRAAYLVAAGCTIDVAATGRERFENRIEALHDVGFAADHLTIAPFEAPDAAAGANVTIMDSLGRKFFRAADIIDVVGISTIDDDVVLFKLAN